jgi:enoyl-CoA hydratase
LALSYGPVAKVMVEDHGSVRVLRLNRPDVLNAIDGETAGVIERTIVEFAAGRSARVLIVTGDQRSFSTGADLKDVGSLAERQGWERTGPLGFARLDPGKPVIAAVEGYCFAGGLELALWCDFRIAGEGAEFGVLNRRWGISLVDGGTQRLRSILGVGNALYLLETGARVDTAWALRNGLVQEVVPRGGAFARALELAEQVASYPQASLLADRKGLLRAAGLDLGLRLEAELGYATLNDPEKERLLEAFGGGDRPPSHRPTAG